MSHVSATPQALADAAGNLAAIASTISKANTTAAAGTAGVKAPGGDSVSAFVSALFAVHAQAYQAAGAQAAYYHDLFVQTLRAGAGSYASAEAANASQLEKVPGMVSAASQTFAGHLIGHGANGATGTGQHGGVGGPSPGSGGLGTSGGDGHTAAIGGPQGGNTGGGGANGVPTGDGGATNAGVTNGGGGGAEVADPRGASAGAFSASGAGAAGIGVPTAWGPAVPAVPTGSWVPGLATAPGAPAVIAGGYPAAAGLAGLGVGGVSGDTAAIGGLSEPAAPAAPAAAASLPAEPAIPTAPKAQPLHQANPTHPGDAAHPAHADHGKPALLLPLPLRLPSFRGLRGKLRLGLRDKDEWRKELREAAISKPWGREELLDALGLRPPGNE
jgi:PE family